MSNSPETEMPNSLPLQCVPYAKFTIFYSHSEPTITMHVRAIVDGQVVVRYWSRPKKRWEYEVKSLGWFIAYDSRIRWSATKSPS